MEYSKPALDIPSQLAALQQRGLVINSPEYAMQFLSNVSYFRFDAYLHVLETGDDSHTFKAKTTFEQAAQLYTFDRELRKLLFGAVQLIEIALRSQVIHQFSLAHGPFWFLDAKLAVNKHRFADNLATLERELQRTKEEFIKEHKKKYGEVDYPPSWKILELIPFGCLTKLFVNFADTQAKKRISRSFGVKQPETLESWMIAINVLRNHCAHHARIWNRVMPVMPQNLLRPQQKWVTNFPQVANNAYAIICCIAYWLNVIDPSNTFTKDIKRLLRKFPSVNPEAMGFQKGWRKEPLWL